MSKCGVLTSSVRRNQRSIFTAKPRDFCSQERHVAGRVFIDDRLILDLLRTLGKLQGA